jgi:dipeptidyl aminopeptidase/acylaminoacyl peptidase
LPVHAHWHYHSPQEVHEFGGSIANIKLKKLSDDEVAFACSAITTPRGTIYSPFDEKKSFSSAKTYSSLFVRHWDTWMDENQNSIWYGLLKKTDGKYSLQDPGLTNLLAGTSLVCPVPPFGGTGDFDLSHSGIVFVARDPELSPAEYTKTDLYYVALKSFAEKDPPPPKMVKTGTLLGYSVSPAFSKDGKKVAFARMKNRQYESDKPRLLLIPDITDLSNVQEFYETEDGDGSWDARPEWILWSNDGKELYVSAEKNAKAVLWKLPSNPAEAKHLPEAVFSEGSVLEAKSLGDKDSRLFISSTSLVESSCYSILDLSENSVHVVSSTTKNGKSLGLSRSQCDEIWFKGAEGYDVHALVMKPSTFDPSKKYPLAFLVHGGPQAAWLDNWSTRWNPAVFAEQGYVAVMPNPTGSTGYGTAHTDGIQNEWGGRPYIDLVKCWEYINEKMPYVDTDNGVALGASYGGYMINWIQGNDLGRRFKALVCHDGVYSTQNQWATEELFFPLHDFCGTIWDNRAAYEKWDPSKRVGQWATPQLVSLSSSVFIRDELLLTIRSSV